MNNNHLVFPSKYDPEAEKDRVEKSLSYVAVQEHERHVYSQGQPIDRDCKRINRFYRLLNIHLFQI